MYRKLKTGGCVCVILLSFILISCKSVTSSNEATVVMKNELELNQRSAIGKIIGFDESGYPQYQKTNEELFIVDAEVVKVKLVHNTPSIAYVNDTAYFKIESTQQLPELLRFKTIKLRFDEFADPPFTKGDKWRFSFTKKGEFVSLEHLSS